MSSEKRAILNWFYRHQIASGIFEFDRFLFRAASDALSKDDIDAERYVEANANRHWNYFQEANESDARKGLVPTFVVVDREARRFSWYAANISNGSTSKERRYAQLLAARPAILKQIDALDWREYEALSCVVCRALRAENVKLTRSGNEGGIDFYATIPSPTRTHLFAGGQRPLRIIGQCKKYESRVPAEKVRAFLESTRAVMKGYSPNLEVPSWFRQSRGPIVGLMIGHRGFQSGAKGWAKDHGVIWSDSRDLAEVLSTTRLFLAESPEMRAASVVESVHEELRLFA